MLSSRFIYLRFSGLAALDTVRPVRLVLNLPDYATVNFPLPSGCRNCYKVRVQIISKASREDWEMCAQRHGNAHEETASPASAKTDLCTVSVPE